MVLHIEKQRSVQSDLAGTSEGSVMAVQTYGSNSRNSNSKRNQKKDNRTCEHCKMNQKKDDRTCEHCKIKGHVKEACFKLHGYPNWYKELKRGKAGGKGFANASKYTDDSDESTEERKNTTTANKGRANEFCSAR